MHARIAQRIALVAGLAPDSVVLEIGPGTGMLTRELLKKARKVIAVETDAELFEKLKTDFADEIVAGRLELIHGDIRSFDISLLSRGYTLVANIPYYLTGEIFRMFLESNNQPSALTLLVQKEVAERIVARKKKPLDSARGKESILSLSVKAYGIPKREFIVPRGAFRPAPKVDSAVLTVRDISRKNFSAGGGSASGGAYSRKMEERFFALIHAGFAHKRKFVRSNLKEMDIDPSLLTLIPQKARAEDLPLSVWLKLTRNHNA